MSSIDRTAHVLKREKSLIIPRHVIFFDTETSQEVLPNGDIKQTLKMGWACYYRRAYGRNLEKLEWHYFETMKSFWAFVFSHSEKKRRLWVISHNMSFDFTIVGGWKHLKREKYKLKFFHNTGTTCIISVRSKTGAILFVDSMNWFKETLAKIGDRVGVPKLDVDFENVSKAKLKTYCKRDVEILIAMFKDFVKFLESNRISRLCYTIASTAMAAYLFGFYDNKIHIHNNKEAIDAERSAYRGGRVECFYMGRLENQTFYVLDVNSLYPTVMHSGFYPCKFIKTRAKTTPDTLRYNLQTNSVIAHVLIDTPEPVYAVKRNRTIFPVGRFWVTLTSPELIYALKHSHIKKVGRYVIYERAKLFTRYVDRMYKLRHEFKLKQSGSYSELCKLLLNSLYGKFGQKAEQWEKIGDAPNERDRTEQVYLPDLNRRGMIRYLLGEVWQLTGYEECFNSFPGIAATVTGYARMYLYDLMKTAGAGNYYYCDTDSLIVNAAGLKNLESRIDTVKLGSLKLEAETNWLDIRGLKDYSIDGKTVIKGVSKKAIKIDSAHYQQQQWPSLRGILKSNNSDGYTVKQVTKTLSRKYTKGIVKPDGWTRPFSLDDADLLFPLPL